MPSIFKKKENMKVLRGMSRSELNAFEELSRNPRTELGRKNRSCILSELRRRKR